MGDDLDRLATLIRKKNEVDKAVSALIGDLPPPGNIGEFVAARILGIRW